MILIIGGAYQGKCAFALETYDLSPDDVFVCTTETREIDLSASVISHIEQFALGCLRRGGEPKDYWESILPALSEKVLISDDISCGVVPIDAEMRAWREASGRACNYLAREAEQVWRVFCGLGARLK